LQDYPVIILHLEYVTNDPKVMDNDKAKIRGYLTTLKSFKFVTTLLLFCDLLSPVVSLSESLQHDAISLLQATNATFALQNQTAKF